MGALSRFHGHFWHRCKNDDPDYRCVVCENAMPYCVTCGAGEGALPTDCPGTFLPTAYVQRIAQGKLDFDWKLGWIERDAQSHRAAVMRRKHGASWFCYGNDGSAA